MQKKTFSESGFFNLRTITGCALFCAASLLAYFSFAAPALSNASNPLKSAPASIVDWRAKVDAAVLNGAALGETEFLIYMKQQSDLSGASSLNTKNEKGQYVYEKLTATAQATQSDVKQTLGQLGAQYKAFWISNTIWGKGNLTVVQAVAVLPEVAAIYPVGKGALQLPAREKAPSSPDQIAAAEPGLIKAKAPDAWALGYEGQGVVVAGADTGVRFTHDALRNQYRGWGGTPEASTHDYNWHDAIHIPNWPPEPTNACNPGGLAGAGQPSPFPCDDDVLLGGGHGSHTMGTMAGDDGGANEIGMAPQAKWMACRNMSNGVGAIPTYLECMEWFIAPTKVDGTSPDPTKAPHVINNSWGCLEGCPPDPNPLRDSLIASRAAGIVYVASAGNDGSECNTIFHPLARYPEAFTVGSTTHTTDEASSFSSRGPAAIDPENPGEPFYRKPDISAPGSTIRSALRGSDSLYDNLSGTSMAGPHVAGLVALVISANPALAGNVDRIEEIIEQSAEKKTTTEGCGGDTNTQVPNNTYGWGRIDALAAVTIALADPTPTPTPTPSGTATPTPSGTATPTPSGTATPTPTVTPTATPNATPTASPTASPTPTSTQAQLLNISTRARVQTGDNVLIGGFIISGNDPKKVLLRAMGPSIQANGAPVPGRMADPTLELRNSNGALLDRNDNWKDSAERTEIEATGIPPSDDKESAIARNLVPGAYTAILRGKDNTAGIALVEVYDRASANSILANISSRSFVEAGDNVMIGGFIAGSQTESTKILVRAIGPSIKNQLPNALDDPTLELRDSNGVLLTSNDNWKDSPERTEIEATGIPPTNDLESAIVRTLPPAAYTAIVRGKNDTIGVGVVEIYNIR